MRRLVAAVLGIVVVLPVRAQTPTPEQKQATVTWLRSMQKAGSGFAGDEGKDATVATTTAAVQALRHFGGTVPDPAGCAKFLAARRDPFGGYRILSTSTSRENRMVVTAQGVIAMSELKKDPDANSADLAFLADYAGTNEEIRMAAAAFEAVYGGTVKFPVFDKWLAQIQKSQNDDGTFGAGDSKANDTATGAVTVLRLGGQLANKDAIIQVLKDAQRPDGGFSEPGAEGSDLATTYRIMRALAMLKAKPDEAACRKFVASCRNDNGSYKLRLTAPPAQQGRGQMRPQPNIDAVMSTYFAGAINHWLDAMK
jgi:prenyltransferase beta subunit